jgi:hypothetical protein
MTGPKLGYMDFSTLRLAIAAVRECWPTNADTNAGVVIAAAEAHLATLPRTKTISVWRVESCVRAEPTAKWWPSTQTCETAEEANQTAEKLRRVHIGAPPVPMHDCIRVTGPHEHEVPV